MSTRRQQPPLRLTDRGYLVLDALGALGILAMLYLGLCVIVPLLLLT
jgi:hypothetical protein